MASEQVLSWIKNEVRLSKPVQNFEADFSNGLFFGEILHQFDILPDLSQFSKKTNKEAKVQNFYQIEQALRDMKVKFDARLIHNIMNEERGAALRLLYQIKRAVQLKDAEMSETGLKKSLLDKVKQQRMEQTNMLAESIEYKTVGGKDVRSNKLKLQDRHLVGFDIQQKMLFEKAVKDAEAEDKIIAEFHQGQRLKMITSLQENQTFMKQWEQEGIENWKKNNQTRAENLAKVKYFEDREVNIYKSKLERELNAATSEQQDGISEFEKNLQKLGIEQNVMMDEALRRMEERKGIPPGQIQNFSYAATMNKIKETKKANDFAGKERERRRRKMVVDQAATQAELDKQREENMLIQKLLNAESDHAQQAFIDKRIGKCKTMVEDDRLKKAEEFAVKTQAKSEAISMKRTAEAKAAEPQRKAEHEAKKIEYSKADKQIKQQKRRINIEIASGIVDLLLDLGSEAFELIKDRPNHKLNKDEWRGFADMFKAGKKVSLRNVKKRADVKSMQADQNELVFPANTTATDIMINHQSDSALSDFYQYLSGTGQFDLISITPELWHQLQQATHLTLSDNSDFKPIEPNLGLAPILNDLKTRIIKRNFHPLQQSEPVKIPTDFALRLAILGRAFAGKKTVAKQIQELYGGPQNVRIFNMDEIIIEAIEYVTPKKIEEAAASLDKKAPVKKGAEQVKAPVDVFEGKNTTEYKRIANELKSTYFPDFEGEWTTKIDLTNQVLDDKILVELFTERLKLEYEGKAQKKPDLRQGCIRELEILRQLRDIELQQEQEANKVPDLKKKAPTKAVMNTGPEEALRKELESIRKMDVNGWILVGFPKTLAQAKLLEKSLSGFEMKSDQPKPAGQKLQDAWSKVAAPASMIPEQVPADVVPSGLDGVLFMQVPDDECQRRAKNRKIDPVTNTVYHMEDDPPEQSKDNAKLLERLQVFTNEAGNSDRIATASKRYDHSFNTIYQFTEQFGLVDAQTQTCQVPLNMLMKLQNWRNKVQVKEAVFEQVKKIIQFKQAQYQAVREKILAQVEEDRAKNPDGQRTSQLSNYSRSPRQSMSKQQSHEKLVTEKNDKKTIIVTISNESLPKESLRADTKSQKSLAPSFSAMSSRIMRRMYEINDTEKAIKWEQMVNNYYKEGMQGFSLIRSLRQRVLLSLNQTQQSFITFLERPGSLQKKINDFCENYNKFNQQFPQLLDNEKTQEELQNRVKILSLQLWEIIQQRNQEAVKERAKYMEGGWVYVEMIYLVSYIARLIENEWERFQTINAVITGVVVNEELDLQILVKKLAERGIEPYIQNENDNGSSPIIQALVQTMTDAITTVFNEQHFINLDQYSLEIINQEKDNLFLRVNTLIVWGVLSLEEISIQSNKVFEVLDDWIVVSVKTENELCQKAVKELKDMVQQKLVQIDTVLLGKLHLLDQINTLTFEDGLPLYLQEYQPRNDNITKRIDVDNLISIFEAFKSNSAGGELLDTQTFISLMLLFLQQRNLPSLWRAVSFERIIELTKMFKVKPQTDDGDDRSPLFGRRNSGLTNRQFVNWKVLFTAMLLCANETPSRQDLIEYLDRLKQVSDGELISEDSFINTPAFFDYVEGEFLIKPKRVSPDASEEEEIDMDRILAIKQLLYRTFKVTNKEGMRLADYQNALAQITHRQESVFEDIFM